MRFRAPSDRIFLIPPAQHTNDVAVQRRSAPAALLGATIGTVVRTAQAKEKQSFGVIAESIHVRDRTLVHIEDDENGAAVSALSLPLLPLGACVSLASFPHARPDETVHFGDYSRELSEGALRITLSPPAARGRRRADACMHACTLRFHSRRD